MTTTVAAALGTALAEAGVRTVFGVVGSGNFHVTNALAQGGARFVAARHEGAAAVMADAYARVSGELGVLSVHQGPGLTNALTGITEAAKSGTPLLVLAAEATSPRSNFHVDQAALATAVGAVAARVTSPATAAADLRRAYHTALASHRTVLLNLPLDVQAAPAPAPFPAPAAPRRPLPRADADAVAALADALTAARRPVFIAGRGARHADSYLKDLAERSGALLATSAVSRGLFRADAFNLDVSGGFATPAAAGLIKDADLLIGWGCALNMWTLRHGTLVGPDTTVVQVDIDSDALGSCYPVDLGVVGDVAATAEAVLAELGQRREARTGYRTPAVGERLARERRWRDVPYEEHPEPGRIDPRTLSIALDDLLPGERTVAVDSGNFMGYPAMFLDVPDAEGFVFTQAYQSVGLGLASAIGAAVARPDRLTVAAAGDGGLLMGISELETAVRLGLDMLVVVYDDEAYGAEVHHFAPGGYPLDTVRFPPADIAAIGRGFGCEGVTVTRPAELAAVADWVKGPRDRPLIVDAKVTRSVPSWWLEEAFR
ncbi:MAG TPA: thiamine pyrophosphate-binding protein [Trebonia sp.]|nr:thiamine pyrophosphate-binding protein [Trebonia sp.]